MKARIFTVALALVVSAVAVRTVGHGEPVHLSKPFWQFPREVAAWEGRDIRLTQAIETRVGVSSYMYKVFVRPEARLPVHLYVGFYESQKHGEMIHSPKNCLPGAGWEPVEASLVTVALAAPHPPITVNRYLIQKERAQQVVLYWYQSQGQAIAGEVPARIAMVRSALVRNRTDGAIVRVMSPVYDSVRETSERLVAYVQAMYPLLGDFLPD